VTHYGREGWFLSKQPELESQIVKSQRLRHDTIRQATLFKIEKTEETGGRAGEQEIERPYTLPGIFLGTSSFTASGWERTFYPHGLKSRDFLTYYATQFATVEIDSTFYGCPSANTVSNWAARTPDDFVFCAKVPQTITHEKALVDCTAEFEEFVKTMDILGPKLGPMLFQFPWFDRWKFPKQDSFLTILTPFLKRLPADHKFVIEIRNKQWLDAQFTDVLRDRNVALALTDTSFMPRPWELKQQLDLITADFAYVRWLGDRKGIEKQTKTWDKVVVNRTDDLMEWVKLMRMWTTARKFKRAFLFANNHYQGYAPATVDLFRRLWSG